MQRRRLILVVLSSVPLLTQIISEVVIQSGGLWAHLRPLYCEWVLFADPFVYFMFKEAGKCGVSLDVTSSFGIFVFTIEGGALIGACLLMRYWLRTRETPARLSSGPDQNASADNGARRLHGS